MNLMEINLEDAESKDKKEIEESKKVNEKIVTMTQQITKLKQTN